MNRHETIAATSTENQERGSGPSSVIPKPPTPPLPE